MASHEKLVLVAVCSLAALTSFAGVLAVLSNAPKPARRPIVADVPTPPPAPVPFESASRNAAMPPSGRFAYSAFKDLQLPAPVDDLRQTLPAETDDGTADTAQTEPADAPNWTVETHAEPHGAPGVSRGPGSAMARLLGPATPAAPPVRTYSLAERLAEISPQANIRLATRFQAAKAEWPPAEMVLLAIKDEKVVELHARAQGGAWKLVHRYPVLAASGGAGPKLRQGDRQVPEGIYGISYLNPNSRYHVSLRVNYPNAFDRQMASQEGRRDLGGDIMIHGKAASVGCLAVGDPASEEMFVLAAQVGLANVKLIIAPTDFRRNGVPEMAQGQPPWLGKLYTEVAGAMSSYKRPPNVGLLSFFSN